MRGAVAITAIALALVAPGAAIAQSASLPDIEDEVMCTICGTTLALSNSPQAERQRIFINELIADGRSKDEIKDALVAEYGSEVLAVPSDDGFDLIGGWILPAIGVLVGAGLVIAAALRWRRSRREETESSPAAAPLASEDDDRLQKDLDLYA